MYPCSQNGSTVATAARLLRFFSLWAVLFAWQTTFAMDRFDLNAQLLRAARAGDIRRIGDLLDRGAAIGAQDNNGKTALHRAALGGHIEALSLLLHRGADIGAQDNNGRTALHEVAQMGRIEALSLLLSSGANPYMLDRRGRAAGDARMPFSWGSINREELMQQYEEQLQRSAIRRSDLTVAIYLEQVRRDGLLRLPASGLLRLPASVMETIVGYLVDKAYVPHILLQPGDPGIKELSTAAYRDQHALLQDEGVQRHALSLMCERGYQHLNYARWAHRHPEVAALVGEEPSRRRAIEDEQKRHRRGLMSTFDMLGASN